MDLKTPCEIKVTEENTKERIDLYLKKKLRNVSRSLIQEALKNGKILLNEAKTSYKTIVKQGDSLKILEPFRTPHKINLSPSSLPLSILYEDSDLIIVNKEAKISTHPSLSEAGLGQTLVESLLTHCEKENLWEKERQSSERPGVVHRLDKNTTGALVWAKNEKTLVHLQKQFKEKTNKREYLVLLEGEMKEKQILCESFLIRDQKNKTRFTSTQEKNKGGKWAKSLFKLETIYSGKYTLCSVTLHTGRTHQIRVHAKELGLPVLGDPLYNIKKTVSEVFSPRTRKLIEQLSRQMLHAKTLGFIHPRTEKSLTFEAPLPEDFKTLLESFEL
jgi:23S rRNA pseudouridine1911/1915/1917 synthase